MGSAGTLGSCPASLCFQEAAETEKERASPAALSAEPAAPTNPTRPRHLATPRHQPPGRPKCCPHAPGVTGHCGTLRPLNRAPGPQQPPGAHALSPVAVREDGCLTQEVPRRLGTREVLGPGDPPRRTVKATGRKRGKKCPRRPWDKSGGRGAAQTLLTGAEGQQGQRAPRLGGRRVPAG